MYKIRIMFLVLLIVSFAGITSSFAENDVSRAYDEALNAMKKENYSEAVEKLSSISFYLDSAELSVYCQAHVKAADGDYDGAVSDLNRLSYYRDAEKCIAYFQAREAESTANSFYSRARAANLYDSDLIRGFRDASKRAASIRKSLYEEGVKAQRNQEWSTAFEIFRCLDGYEDSQNRFHYCSGRDNEESGQYSAVYYAYAVNAYDRADNYQDSAERKEHCLAAALEKADQLLEEEDFDQVEQIYSVLGEFCDKDRLEKLKEARKAAAEAQIQKLISEADALLEKGLFDEARQKYKEANALDMLNEVTYQEAAYLAEQGEYEKSAEMYLTISQYKDSRNKHYMLVEKLKEARKAAAEAQIQKLLSEADALLEKGLFDEARRKYKEANALDMLNEVTYQEAAYLAEQGEYEKSAQMYLTISQYKDSRNKHYMLGNALMEKAPETASRILLADRNYPGAEEDLYTIAVHATESRNYTLSIAIYREFTGKRDCSLRLENDLYLYGLQLLGNNNPELAVTVFDSISGVGESGLYRNMASYAAAENLEAGGKYEAAAEAFLLISDYADAGERALKCRYRLAKEKKTSQQYSEAADIFRELNNYSDSASQLKSCLYLQAKVHMNDHQWEEAIETFKSLNEYEDSKELCTECYRNLGTVLLADGDPEKAYAAFVSANDTDGQASAAFAAGEAKVADMLLDKALEWYKLASNLPETEERTSMIAQSLLNMEEDSLSEQYASVVENSEKSHAVLYMLAIRSLERKDDDAAMRQLKKAGDISDASELFQEMLNAHVNSLVAQEKYDDAIYLCSNYGDQKLAESVQALKAKSEAEKHAAKVEEANKLKEEGRYEEASALYSEIGETALAEQALAEKKAIEEAARLEAERALAEQAAKEEAARLEAERIRREQNLAREREAAALIEEGRFDDAIAIYQELGEEEMVNEAIYQKAAALNLPDLYLQIPEYKDSREQHYLAGKALLDTDPGTAFRILSDDLQYSDVQDLLYDLASRESQAENYALSSEIFKTLSQQSLNPDNLIADCHMHYIQDMYQYGLKLQASNDWTAAASVFDQVPQIGKAKTHALECRYAAADALEESEEYAQAALAFERLGNYMDAGDRALHNRYAVAKKLMDSGLLEEARTSFMNLQEFSNADQMVIECNYRIAEKLMNAGKYDEADKAFAAIENYKDAAEKRLECNYLFALGLMDNGSYDLASNIFTTLKDYKDSTEKCKECIYQNGLRFMNQPEYNQAIKAFNTIKGYADSANLLVACHSRIGEQKIEEADALLRSGQTMQAARSYDAAYQEYVQAENTEKAESLALIIGDSYHFMNDYKKAMEWYRKAGDTGKLRMTKIAEYGYLTEQYDAAASLYAELGRTDLAEQAIKAKTAVEDAARLEAEKARSALILSRENDALALIEAGQYDEAIEIYRELNETDMINKTLHQKASALIEEVRFDDAIAIYRELNETDMINKTLHQKASALIEEGRFDDAIAIYQELKEKDMVSEAIYRKAAALNMPELYLQIMDYKDAREQHYLAGKALLDTAPETGFDILAEDIRYSDVQELLYDLANRESNAANYILSMKMFYTLSQQPLDPDSLKADCYMHYVQDMYQYGLKLKENEEWIAAAEVFDQVSGIGEAVTRALECRYSAAAALEDRHEYLQAAQAFEKLGKYSDAPNRALENRYTVAQNLMDSGHFEEARSSFVQLKSFSDAQEKAVECSYLIADRLMSTGKYEEAQKAFVILDNYKDSPSRATECLYLYASKAMDEGRYKEASDLFGQQKDYKDSATKSTECIYQYALIFMRQSQYDLAAAEFETIKDYADVSDLLAQCHANMGEQKKGEADILLRSGETRKAIPPYESAYHEYTQTKDIEKTESLAIIIGDCYHFINDYQNSINWYRKAGEEGKRRMLKIVEFGCLTEQYAAAETLALELDSDEARQILYRMGEQKRDLGDVEAALRLFEEAGDVLDARYQRDSMIFRKGVLLTENQDYFSALECFSLIPDYEGVNEKWKEVLYGIAVSADESGKMDKETAETVQNAKMLYANYLIDQKQYEEAVPLLEGMTQTSEVADMLTSTRYLLATAYKEEKEYGKAFEQFSLIPEYQDAREQTRECRYQKALELLNADEFDQAFELFQKITDYRDVMEIIRGKTELMNRLTEWQHSISAGAWVDFGKNENGDPYSWIVLDRNEDLLLVIASDIVGTDSYMKGKPTRTTWNNSYLRTYLNGEFLTAVFDEAERQAINLTVVTAQKSKDSNVSPGNDTQDYIYILNQQEADKYPTLLREYPGSQSWWLRSPSGENSHANLMKLFHSVENSIVKYTTDVSTGVHGIRPVLWVRDNLFNRFSNNSAINATNYLKAKDLMNSGRYEEAIDLFNILGDYLDSEKLLYDCEKSIDKAAKPDEKSIDEAAKPDEKPIDEATNSENATVTNDSDTVLQAPSDNTEIKVGKYVTFGHYPQTREGKDQTPIEWLVLAVEENKALLISRFGLFCSQYNTSEKTIFWANSSIRKVLNNDFLLTAFTAEERKIILNTLVKNETGNKMYPNARGGANTPDKVFLLSGDEAFNLFFSNDEDRRCFPTPYAFYNSSFLSERATPGHSVKWWLRSPGPSQDRAQMVSENGGESHAAVNNVSICVRPAMWINLGSNFF